MARKIVVASGKGGVGKTSVAANLGIRLSKAGKRVCIMDADLGLNNLDVVTGVENLVIYDVADCVEGRCRAKQALVECPAAKNVYVLPSLHSISKKILPQKGVSRFFVERVHILVESSGGNGVSARFHLKKHLNEPETLARLVEVSRSVFGNAVAVLGDF